MLKGKSSRTREWSILKAKKKKKNEAGKMSVDLNVLEVASVVWQGVEE